MSIPKKGSRRVEVDGARFLWRIRKSPTDMQDAYPPTPMTIAIQSETGTSVLIVTLNVTRPDTGARHQTQITPSVLRVMIRRALNAGWDPVGSTGHALEHAVIRDP